MITQKKTDIWRIYTTLEVSFVTAGRLVMSRSPCSGHVSLISFPASWFPSCATEVHMCLDSFQTWLLTLHISREGLIHILSSFPSSDIPGSGYDCSSCVKCLILHHQHSLTGKVQGHMDCYLSTMVGLEVEDKTDFFLKKCSEKVAGGLSRQTYISLYSTGK